MSELENPITTQEQLDSIIGERLKRDREAQGKKYEGYISPDVLKEKEAEYGKTIAELQKSLENNKAASSKFEETIADLNKQVKNYETSSVKQRIAHETGIPYELASRLNGETEEDIRKDAEAMAKFVNKKAAPPLRSDDPDKIDASREALKETLRKLKGE